MRIFRIRSDIRWFARIRLRLRSLDAPKPKAMIEDEDLPPTP